MRNHLVIAAALAALVFAPSAFAGEWLPHAKGDTWTYTWTDSEYNPTPTKEKVTVKTTKNDTFTLAWTTADLGNPTDAVTDAGTVDFQETSGGLMNTNWTSDPPPSNFPILCAQVSQCGNSLASVWFNVVWGARIPTLEEPLVKGTAWTTTGGYQNDVASDSQYMGQETVKVPAFPQPVRAAHVRSDVSQAGAIGDPYGSGVRDVWWVWGVGPVKVVFHHGGGVHAPVTQAVLSSTSLAAQAPPPDDNYFPLTTDISGKFEWTNAKHLKKPEIQTFKVDQSSNGSARISISSVSGPIHTKGAYFYTLRNDGLTNLAGTAKAASLVKLPPLGPASAPTAKRRQFFTVFDLMDFGFNPVLPAYGQAGQTWSAQRASRDFDVYGVTGTSKVVGTQQVHVPAGTFNALEVRTTLRQPGFPWGSGTRTSWFAPGKGLVKLVFQHADGSVSQVVRLK